MQYAQAEIEIALVAAVPEIRPAAQRYWESNGMPGSDSGPYVFFSEVLAPLVELAAASPPSPRRDALLRRALGFIESLLQGDDVEVASLGFDMFGSLPVWWFAQAHGFLGPCTQRRLDEHIPDWRLYARGKVQPTADEIRDVVDLHGIRQVIASEIGRP